MRLGVSSDLRHAPLGGLLLAGDLAGESVPGRGGSDQEEGPSTKSCRL